MSTPSDKSPPSRSILAQNVRARRISLGLNQQQLAERIPVENATYISRLETDGGASPSFEFMQKLARALETRAEWLTTKLPHEMTEEERTLESLWNGVSKLSPLEHRLVLGVVQNLLSGSRIKDISYEPGRGPRVHHGDYVAHESDPRFPERGSHGEFVLSNKPRQRVYKKRKKPADA